MLWIMRLTLVLSLLLWAYKWLRPDSVARQRKVTEKLKVAMP